MRFRSEKGTLVRELLAALVVPLIVTGSAPATADGVDLRVFGDTDYAYRLQNHPTPDDVRNGFGAAKLDLLPTYETDRVSFLAEVLFSARHDGYDIDVERMQVAYVFTDWLRVRAGRMHTAMGYYNDAYHHGSFFELTTARPFLANFEEPDGGLLQTTYVGLGADGRVPLGAVGDLKYAAEVGNGRGHYPGDVNAAEWANDGKLVNLRLRLLPKLVEGLILGVNVESNLIPSRATDQSRTGDEPLSIPNEMREVVLGAHAAYLEQNLHLILEGAAIEHSEKGTSTKYTHAAAFLEAGYSIGTFTPYARYETMRLDSKDPYYQLKSLAGVRVLNDFRYGMKWAATDNIALKLEVQYLKTNDEAEVVRGYRAARAQCSFAF